MTTRRAFTLVELLVVVTIIILILGMTVPVFRTIMGNRSTEAAANQVSAMLARARTAAIGVQQTMGLAFWVNPTNQRTEMAVVAIDEAAGSPVFFDLVRNADIERLPPGTGAQFLINGSIDNSGQRTSDGYIRQPAMILFDGRGQLLNVPYAIRAGSELGNRIGSAFPASIASQIGMVIYDSEAFRARNFTNADPILSGGGYDGAEQDEETWLDQYGMPLMVNRYNGTLIRGESTR